MTVYNVLITSVCLTLSVTIAYFGIQKVEEHTAFQKIAFMVHFTRQWRGRSISINEAKTRTSMSKF